MNSSDHLDFHPTNDFCQRWLNYGYNSARMISYEGLRTDSMNLSEIILWEPFMTEEECLNVYNNGQTLSCAGVKFSLQEGIILIV